MMRRSLPLLLVVVGGAGCSPQFHSTHAHSPRTIEQLPVDIARVELRYSNMFLLRRRGGGGGGDTSHAVLVDAGAPSDQERAVHALKDVGLTPQNIDFVILTHGHGDHAGLGSFFQKSGAKIIVGRGDEAQTTVGHNDEMTSQSIFARFLKPFVRLDYTTFTPDTLVDDTLDLAKHGWAGIQIRHMPGHTRGALVVFVGSSPGPREAIVGDQMLGGIWGGMFHEATAGDHYYQLDPDLNRCNVRALLAEGIETFHLGHGGPVHRDSVLQWQESWSDLKCNKEEE
jgi:hydroxyacylglutathione hydrolase